MTARRLALLVVAALLLGSLPFQPERALATQLTFPYVAHVGETIEFPQFLGQRRITGFRVVPDLVMTVKISEDRSRFQVTCDLAGKVTLTLELSDGTRAVYEFDCRRPFDEFAPAPGGGADDARRYSTGDNTRVTMTECMNPLSCDIANRGREGGFLVRCIGRGSGEGTYVYEFLTAPPVVKVSGKIRGRCPRD